MPLTQRKVKSYSNSNKPWISSEIIKSYHRKKSLYRDYLKSKQGQNYSLYEKLKKYKNKLTALSG